jgi:hypothetical protein
LGQHYAIDGCEALLQRFVGRKIAARRDEAGTLGLIAQRRALEVIANVEPRHVEARAAQVGRAQLGRGELAHAEHARVHARAHLADELDAGDDLRERREARVENVGVDAEIAR